MQASFSDDNENDRLEVRSTGFCVRIWHFLWYTFQGMVSNEVNVIFRNLI